ncbi:hypothetical protein [Conexibacter woesei]|uniref:Uncharacterized protein n=1 Tax=Conexibacter woesei (strain DSM 14684 / CCUG 47730 / CIP 108061 / JCM 11494 / NBRC 100937 / ID131577) TaxID=469383 RepID=D3F5L8_CONWI|nr:hypothetical protein [Conexibacter woesei]ADB52567.1 hypothetical protein Cwoe_4152 [Conexibacter woesei DSM 14684]
MHRLLAAGTATVLTAVLVALVAVAPASARGRAAAKAPTAVTVVKDCARSDTGALKRRYSARVLRQALRRIRGDLAEYTNCYDAVKAQLRRSNATIVAGIRRSSRGAFAKGRLALLDSRGRTVDVLDVRRGKRVTFKVVKGSYTLRANNRRACSVTVTAKARKTVRASVVCR